MPGEQRLGLLDALVEVPQQHPAHRLVVEVVGHGPLPHTLHEGLERRVQGPHGLVAQAEHVGVEHRGVVVGLLRPGHDPPGDRAHRGGVVDVLDAGAAQDRVGVRRDVAGGVHVGGAGPQVLVDDDPAVLGALDRLGQEVTGRLDAQADDHHVGLELLAGLQVEAYAVGVLAPAGDLRPSSDLDAGVGEEALEAGGELGGEHLPAQDLAGVQQRDPAALADQGGGELGADVAASHDRDVGSGVGQDPQPVVVGERAVVEDPVAAGEVGEGARSAAGGDQHAAVADRLATLGGHLVRLGVDGDDPGPRVQRRTGLADRVEGGVLDGEVGVCPQLLGQGGAREGGRGLLAQDADAGVLVLLADAVGGGVGCHPASDDQVVVVRHRLLLRWWRRSRSRPASWSR